MSALLKLLANDEKWKKFNNILTSCVGPSTYNNYVKDLENMHKSRISRTLYLKKPTIDRVIESVTQDGAFRSRYVEILFELNKSYRKLQVVVEAIRHHIRTKYASWLQNNFSTAKDRLAYVDSLLVNALRRLSDYERIIDSINLLVDDIDKYAWNIKAVLESLKILYNRSPVAQ